MNQKSHNTFQEGVCVLDADGDGTISKDELMDTMEEAGITEEDAERLVKEIDTDGDGQISDKDWMS